MRAKLGNEGRSDAELGVGFSLSDTVAMRVAGQTVNRDGVFFDLVDNEETGKIKRSSGRLQLLWEASEATEVLFNLHAAYNRSDRGPRKVLGFWEAGSPNIGTPGNRGAPDCSLLTSSSTDRFEGPNNCVSAVGGTVINPSTSDWNTVYDAANTIAEVDFEGAFIKVDHDFGAITLASISSYDTTQVRFLENTSSVGVAGFFPGQDAEYKVFSQELRLASNSDSNFLWIAGTYYSKEDDILATVIRNGADETPPFTVVPSVSVDQTVEIFSLYGQVEFDLSNALTLTAGLRYTDDSKEGTSTARVIAGTDTGRVGAPRASDDFFFDLAFVENVTADPSTGQCPPPVGGLPCVLGPTPVSQDLQEVGGKIGIDYRFNDDVLAYTSYSRGFKSGAFDTRALAAFAGNADRPVGPEFLDAYEIGVKSTLLDGVLELNASLFYYEWEDLQIFGVDPDGGVAFLNVPKTELSGAEIDIKWAPGAGWYIQGGVGFLDTEITDTGTLNNVVLGASLDNSPELSASGVVVKEFELNSGLFSLQVDFSYTDDAVDGLTNNPIQQHESTLFWNARASYAFGNERQYEAAIWGENLGEEKQCKGGARLNGTLSNNVGCNINPGIAFYGVSFQVDF